MRVRWNISLIIPHFPGAKELVLQVRNICALIASMSVFEMYCVLACVTMETSFSVHCLYIFYKEIQKVEK